MNRPTGEVRKRRGKAKIGSQHWTCPDCFLPCRCEGLARAMPHVRCGGAIRTQNQIDEGMRQAYASWLRSHSVPGGSE